MAKRRERSGDKEKGRVLRFEQDHAFFAKLGDMKRAQNDPVSAISRYREALMMEPHDLDTRLAAAEVLTDMGRFNDSNKLLIPYMHEDEDFKREAYCIVGFNFLGLNEFEGARSCFNRFFDMTDEVSERTDAMLDALDYIDSFSDESPILLDAKELEIRKRIAEANEAFDRGNFELSANVLRDVVKQQPDNTGVLYDLALSCLCSYHADESETYIDRLLELDEENWPAWSLKLMYAKGKKNEIEVQRICRRLEKCNSVQPDELFRVNGSLLEAECPELALIFAKRLVKLLPYDTLANHRLAICYAKLKQYSRAMDVYGMLLKIDGDDHIARYYRSLCVELEKNAGEGSQHEFTMLQYQLPFDKVILVVKELMGENGSTVDDITARWDRDDDFRRVIRWAFTLHEANIDFAMMNLLRIINREGAEYLIREACADLDAGRPLINEGFGSLKRRDAKEPFFAVYKGNLLEGRVNLVDFSKIKIPKGYLRIYDIYREKTEGLYSAPAANSARSNWEKFVAGCGNEFKQLSKERSAALAAALEVLSCEECGIEVTEDLLERYDVTQKRLMNAIDEMINVMVYGLGKSFSDDPERGQE